MVILDKIYYKNFLNVVEQEITLRDQGLVLVTGKNGSGKSAMFIEGIYYALYGKSFKYKTAADSVINEYCGEKEDSYVHLWLEVDGLQYQIVRVRRHPTYPKGVSVYLDGKDLSRGTSDDTQEFINSLVGMSASAFAYSVVFNNKILKFPLLKDSEKKAIFDEILQLEVLNQGLEVTKAAIKKLKEDKKTYTEKRKFSLEAIERFSSEMLSTERDFNLWEAGRSERIRVMKDMLEDISSSIRTLETKKKTFSGKVDSAKLELQKRRGAYDKMQKMVREEETKHFEEELAFSEGSNSVNSSIASEEAELRRLKKLVEQGRCRECSQVIQAATFSNDFSRIEEKIASLTKKKAEYAAIRAELDSAKKEIEKAKEELEEERDAVMSMERHSLRTLEDEYDKVCEALSEAMAEKAKYAAKLESEEGADNPNKLKLESVKGSLSVERATVRSVESNLNTVTKELEEEEIIEAVLGQKGARLHMIQSALPLLNKEAVETQSVMGTHLSVVFKLRSSDESYGGNMVVEVFNPKGAKNYEGDSDGERQCVDLILLMSLLALVSSRGIKSFVQSFYDEIFDALDAANEIGVLNVLKHIATNKNSVFIISHKTSQIGGQCDKVWAVENGRLFEEAA